MSDTTRFELHFRPTFATRSNSSSSQILGYRYWRRSGRVVRIPQRVPAGVRSRTAGGYDVLISLKPRSTAASLRGVDRLCAIGRCGVGYDNVDLEACTAQDVAVYITPAGVVRPMAESIVLLVLALSHNLVWKDHLVRQRRWGETTLRLGREPRGRTVGTIGLETLLRPSADQRNAPVEDRSRGPAGPEGQGERGEAELRRACADGEPQRAGGQGAVDAGHRDSGAGSGRGDGGRDSGPEAGDAGSGQELRHAGDGAAGCGSGR